MAEEKAYIGYRSAGRRPEGRQDRRAAADAPLSALRGAVSGVLGAPGDIEALIRMLPGLSERTVLPTSEDVEKRLPLPELNRTPTGRAFTTAGQLGGGFYNGPGSPLRAIAALPSAVSRAGRDFAAAAGGSGAHVIKPKGGNWLAGSVERAVEPMKQTVRPQDFLQRIADDEARGLTQPGMLESVIQQNSKAEAMNRWLEGKLAKYIRNEMGTPEDPVRALAERGVLHTELPEYGPFTREDLRHVREMEGFPGEGLAQSELGRRWEQAADLSIYPSQARHLALTKEVDTNPWLLKVPPETMVYEVGPRQSQFQSLGFNHLVDELRNAVNPESGLPANLQWKYADLDKVTVPQAVQRVADINDWRAAQKAEADMARAMNPATFTHKEYPEQGLKWVELRKPESVEFSDEVLRKAMQERDMMPDEIESALRDPEMRAMVSQQAVEDVGPLADALKYEGETMGHCVGGYCPDVLEGRSRIYSLRDKKGQPHVTIEVAPQRSYGTDHLEKFRSQAQDDALVSGLNPGTVDNPRADFLSFVNKRMSELADQNLPMDIVQIKGKGNKAPKAEYLPAVQDFVRSGQWGRVGDLENTGLRRIEDTSGVRYLTEQEFKDALDNRYQPDLAPKTAPDAEGFASGGLVEYNPAKIQSLVDTLREEMYG